MKMSIKEVKKIKENNISLLESNPEILKAIEFMEKEIEKAKESNKIIYIVKKYGLANCNKAIVYVKNFGYKPYSKVFANPLLEEEVLLLIKTF